jgi:hypothetical protein
MTKDDILQALRLTAMGRTGHPLQEQLAEKLEAVFAREQVRTEARAAGDELMAMIGSMAPPAILDAHVASAALSPLETPAATFKRRKKAD